MYRVGVVWFADSSLRRCRNRIGVAVWGLVEGPEGGFSALEGPTSDWPSFRRFVEDRWTDIEALLANRSTQTNEAARCAALLPVLASIRSPIALVEVGASAGLCLFPDRYAYSYGGEMVGESTVQFEVDCTGSVPIPPEMPMIAWRRGIDIHPLDVTDDADVAWLSACIWPEHQVRRERLERAVLIAAGDPPTIVAGDLVAEIDGVLESAPTDAVTVVFHSAVLSYLSVQDRRNFAEKMVERPDVAWISNEAPGVVESLTGSEPPIGSFVLGRNGSEVLAHTDPHGAWLAWADSARPNSA